MQRFFLTGLSGSGKSTIGREIARLLGWNFIDTDEALATSAGMPTGQALLAYGEERFRQLETEILAQAAAQERVVIATGGGVVISEMNRAFMREQGAVVYLQVPVETAWRRIQEHLQQHGAHAARPLVAGEDGMQRLQALYATRKAWYEEADIHLDSGEAVPEQLARRLIASLTASGYLATPSAQREILSLYLGKMTSQAIVEWGGLHHLAPTLQAFDFPRRVFLVTDSEVGALYASSILGLLEEAGFEPRIFTIAAGEASKSFASFQRIIDWLVEQKAELKEPLIALGGGVVGDLTGFVASCYYRGVPLVQVPTSLLAQVDSAIGGKTGINHPLGKNLIGAFYQPALIYVDPAMLLTLPERAYREGWAEIVKYAIILDAELFDLLEQHTGELEARDPALLSAIVARCIRMKMDVVQRDERDSGLRNILNYGHTFGHALEAITDYGTWLHGEAVSIGMEVAARIAVASGQFSAEEAARQARLLQALHLPVRCPGVDGEVVLEAMQRDKKVRAGRKRWVLPTRIGHAEVFSDIDPAIVRAALAEVCQEQG